MDPQGRWSCAPCRRGKVPQKLGLVTLDPYLSVSQQGLCLTAFGDSVGDRRLVQLDPAGRADGVALPAPVRIHGHMKKHWLCAGSCMWRPFDHPKVLVLFCLITLTSLFCVSNKTPGLQTHIVQPILPPVAHCLLLAYKSEHEPLFFFFFFHWLWSSRQRGMPFLWLFVHQRVAKIE